MEQITSSLPPSIDLPPRAWDTFPSVSRKLIGNDRSNPIAPAPGCTDTSLSTAGCSVPGSGVRQVATGAGIQVTSTSGGGHGAGTSLVETMVALIILGIGLLGMGGLQGLSTHYGHSAYLQSQALLQIQDLTERMRANHGAVIAGDYWRAPIADNYSRDCRAETCSREQMADYDLVTWDRKNATLLPHGRGVVTRNPDGSTHIEVAWRRSWVSMVSQPAAHTTSLEFSL